MKSLVVAIGKNNEMGQKGDMPWSRGLPADLANFKKLTTGKSIIMGRKTFESIGSRPLPNRQNIVVTSTPTGVDGVISCVSLETAYAMAQYDPVVIGGARLYEEALKNVDTLTITRVDAEFPEADTFFPDIKEDDWLEVMREYHDADERNAYAFDFIRYERK